MRNNNGRLRDDLTTYLHGKWQGIGRSFSKSWQKNCHKARKNELGVQSSEWMTEIMKMLILKSIGGISQLGSFKSTGEGEAGSEMLPYNWLTLVSMPFQRQWIKGFLVCFWYPYIFQYVVLTETYKATDIQAIGSLETLIAISQVLKNRRCQ